MTSLAKPNKGMLDKSRMKIISRDIIRGMVAP
jgi:hypothetical protein